MWNAFFKASYVVTELFRSPWEHPRGFKLTRFEIGRSGEIQVISEISPHAFQNGAPKYFSNTSTNALQITYEHTPGGEFE